MHLDEEQIQRFLHGELVAHEEAAVRAHVETCAACRELVTVASREDAEVSALLRRLDHAPPSVDAASVAARARVRRPGWGRWAASVLLALGAAGVAYAAPHSPLRGWVGGVLGWVSGSGAPSPPPDSATAAAPGFGAAGIAFEPGPVLTIVFSQARAPGLARVTLYDGPEVDVRAVRGAASFTSDADRLVITGPDSPAEFEIRIPRDAPRVEIRVGGRRAFLKEGTRVVSDASPDARGMYRISLSPAGL